MPAVIRAGVDPSQMPAACLCPRCREKKLLSLIQKQDRLLYLTFYMLLNLSEDVGVERKMKKKVCFAMQSEAWASKGLLRRGGFAPRLLLLLRQPACKRGDWSPTTGLTMPRKHLMARVRCRTLWCTW